ncbi:MAG: tRNA 2-thiouridine(34) synthase MnmA [Paludibacteraceae bacterium]|nr:tRNA 2-thiouridine(34) synthase MnmA [Paludibacteraceae bacterium]
MASKRVVLGMSGGTDSSVSVLLLQDAGYEVVGVTFRFGEEMDEEALSEVKDLAQRMGIEHHIIDAREEFQRTVVDYFVNEYMAGRTPVPCLVCNNRMKWRLLEQKANELGITWSSTGHYAQIQEVDGIRYVVKGVDEMKDQSFFLWGLSQSVLSKIVLPLGQYEKSQIRKIAADRGYLKVATRRDSMGVCFCPGDYRTFLKNHISIGSEAIRPGDFVDEHGTYLGRHNGYPFYTVGQRRGLGVQARTPLYVKSVFPENNQVVLSSAQGLQCDTIELRDWNVPSMKDLQTKVTVRYRYERSYVKAKVEMLPNGNLIVRFDSSVMGVAPGQAACFYDGDRVVGGGIIV